jgi:hypothetical protein
MPPRKERGWAQFGRIRRLYRSGMKNLIGAALLLLALPAFADGDSLPRRLAPLLGDGHILTLTYRTYRSGRPRLVVAAVEREEERGEVLLVRFPDARGGRPRVLHRLPFDSRPTELQLARATEPDDILLRGFGRRTPPVAVYRVAGQRLVKIAAANAWGDLITADLEGDAVPEIISVGCCQPALCGDGVLMNVQKYDGTRYRSIGRNFIDLIRAPAGSPPVDDALRLPADSPPRKTRRCRFHIVNNGTASARVQVDGTDLVAPDRLRGFKRIQRTIEFAMPRAAGGCPTVHVSVEGPPGTSVSVLVEELP